MYTCKCLKEGWTPGVGDSESLQGADVSRKINHLAQCCMVRAYPNIKLNKVCIRSSIAINYHYFHYTHTVRICPVLLSHILIAWYWTKAVCLCLLWTFQRYGVVHVLFTGFDNTIATFKIYLYLVDKFGVVQVLFTGFYHTIVTFKIYLYLVGPICV